MANARYDLTDDERTALELLGQLRPLIYKLLDATPGGGTVTRDINTVQHITELEHFVLAQVGLRVLEADPSATDSASAGAGPQS